MERNPITPHYLSEYVEDRAGVPAGLVANIEPMFVVLGP